MKTLLLVGATGLVGQSVLVQALADDRVERVVALTRRPLPPHPKLENPLVDFSVLPAAEPWWRVDAVICALGTTIRRAGSEEAFHKVDFAYPLAVATLAWRHGTPTFALTSSLGADPRARTFYLRTKGELEEALAGLGFASLTIVRPSILGGTRLESRPMEKLSIALVRALGPVLPRRYRVAPAERVASALLATAVAAMPGRHVVESETL
ncbi:MAG: NAD-dependent dehydratase [Opitutus sp.]|nr:NAD-dependent dehydratase [Opitutus sp.]